MILLRNNYVMVYLLPSPDVSCLHSCHHLNNYNNNNYDRYVGCRRVRRSHTIQLRYSLEINVK